MQPICHQMSNARYVIGSKHQMSTCERRLKQCSPECVSGKVAYAAGGSLQMPACRACGMSFALSATGKQHAELVSPDIRKSKTRKSGFLRHAAISALKFLMHVMPGHLLTTMALDTFYQPQQSASSQGALTLRDSSWIWPALSPGGPSCSQRSCISPWCFASSDTGYMHRPSSSSL